MSELSRLRGSGGYEACADERAKDLATRPPSRRAGAQETIPLVVLMQFRSLRLQPDKQSEEKEGVSLAYFTAAREIGQRMQHHMYIVDKSTIPVESIRNLIFCCPYHK